MKLGLSTYSFPWAFGVTGYEDEQKMSIEQLLTFAAGNGIRYVQIGDNYPLAKLNPSELNDLRSLADRDGIRLQAGMRRLDVANVKRYIQIAISLGSPFLRIVIDENGYHPDEDKIIDIIRELLPEIKKANIPLAIENHDRLPSDALLRIIAGTDSRYVGICLDTANSLGALEGTYETVRMLAPHTLNLHIKDIIIKRHTHKMGFRIDGAAAGSGMLDIPRILDEVKKYGRCETVTLEVWSSFSNDITQTRATEDRLVTESLQYLKTITG